MHGNCTTAHLLAMLVQDPPCPQAPGAPIRLITQAQLFSSTGSCDIHTWGAKNVDTAAAASNGHAMQQVSTRHEKRHVLHAQGTKPTALFLSSASVTTGTCTLVYQGLYQEGAVGAGGRPARAREAARPL